MERIVHCPLCSGDHNHIVQIAQDGRIFAWCQNCFRVHVAESITPPSEPKKAGWDS